MGRELTGRAKASGSSKTGGRGKMQSEIFFILSKTVGTLTVPSHIITLMIAAGLILLACRIVQTGRCLLVASLIFVGFLGVFPLGKAMQLVLEQRFPPWRGTGEPTGIIVLGGAIDP